MHVEVHQQQWLNHQDAFFSIFEKKIVVFFKTKQKQYQRNKKLNFNSYQPTTIFSSLSELVVDRQLICFEKNNIF